jgi:hypothetical protein
MPRPQVRKSEDDRLRRVSRPKPIAAIGATRHATSDLMAAAIEIIRSSAVPTRRGVGTLALFPLMASLYGTGH